jgi:hypothetical protein
MRASLIAGTGSADEHQTPSPGRPDPLMDSRLRGHDRLGDFLRGRQLSYFHAFLLSDFSFSQRVRQLIQGDPAIEILVQDRPVGRIDQGVAEIIEAL